MAAEQQFRGAAFGGFQRQDVLDYIEASAREHTAKIEALQKELEQTRAARVELEGERNALSAGRAAAAAELEAAVAAQAKAATELEERTARMARLEEENAVLRARVAELEAPAQAYLAVKDRAAGIELEAHIRAQAAETAAQERVRETQAELEQWALKVRARYDRLRTDMDATISHAGGELERVAKVLAELSVGFSQRDTELEGIVNGCRLHDSPSPLKVDGN